MSCSAESLCAINPRLKIICRKFSFTMMIAFRFGHGKPSAYLCRDAQLLWHWGPQCDTPNRWLREFPSTRHQRRWGRGKWGRCAPGSRVQAFSSAHCGVLCKALAEKRIWCSHGISERISDQIKILKILVLAGIYHSVVIKWEICCLLRCLCVFRLTVCVRA